MKQKWTIMILLTILVILTLLFVGCKQTESIVATVNSETEATSVTQETLPQLPDAVLYYGEIKEIQTDDSGKLSRLEMDSEKYGPYVMNMGDMTYYIDSGKRTSFDPDTLKPGDRVYVFHSPIATHSLPPQSSAFVVLHNIPMDASCGMYHEVEGIQEDGESLLITTDNGEKILKVTQETQVIAYTGESIELSNIEENAHVIAWYWDQGTLPLHTSHLMLLP